MEWPFHCAAPQVQFLDNAVEVTWWRERESDLNRLAPRHRAAFTYMTWKQPLNRTAPYGFLSDELAPLGDPDRFDGTCSEMSDGTVSALTTMYNSADDSIAAADFSPCVGNAVPDGDPRLPNVTDQWFETGSDYPSRGWIHRFSIALSAPPAIGNCSLQYTSRRLIPTDAKALYVVQLGSATGCTKEFCAGANDPLVTFGGDELVRMVTRWPVPGSPPVADVAVDVSSAVVRRIGSVSRTTVKGHVLVDDPLFWPASSSVFLQDAGGPCNTVFGNATRSGGVWNASFTWSCGGTATRMVQPFTISTLPWPQIGGVRIAVADLTTTNDAAPPKPVGVPSSRLVPIGATVAVRFGLEMDDAFWEVVSVDGASLATSTGAMINAPPPASCGDSRDVSALYLTGSAAIVNVKNTHGGRVVAVCLNAGVAPVTPIGTDWPPRWRSAAAAARFSLGGNTSRPVWDNGTAVISGAPIGYPYSTAVDLTPHVFTVISPWMGFSTTVQAAAIVQNSTGRAVTSPPPPPPINVPIAVPISVISTSQALPPVAIALLCISGALLVTAFGIMLWYVVSPPPPKVEDEPRIAQETTESDRKGREDRARSTTVRGTGASLRFMALLLMPCLAMGCTSLKTAACNSCAGQLAPSTCMCTCGYSKVESMAYALFAFPAITMMFLYV